MDSTNMTPNNTSNDTVEALVDTMLEGAGLQNLPEDFLLTYREQLTLQVEQRIGLIILSELSDEDAQEYLNRFVEAGQPDPNQVQEFLAARIENFEQKIKKGVGQLVQEFVTAAKTE